MWTREDAKNVSAEYRAEEKKVRNLIRNAKRNLERKLATENGGNSKPFYAYLKSKTKSKSTVGPLLNEQKRIVADKKGMAEVFNNYFASVFTQEPPGPVPEPDHCDYESELRNF
jgi:hypothetical protein